MYSRQRLQQRRRDELRGGRMVAEFGCEVIARVRVGADAAVDVPQRVGKLLDGRELPPPQRRIVRVPPGKPPRQLLAEREVPAGPQRPVGGNQREDVVSP